MAEPSTVTWTLALTVPSAATPARSYSMNGEIEAEFVSTPSLMVSPSQELTSLISPSTSIKKPLAHLTQYSYHRGHDAAQLHHEPSGGRC